jgi:NAD(P)-dependent dehydrogenase (short-subunit alcohol dehydrogenase family)
MQKEVSMDSGAKKFAGRHVIITGGGTGIGRATAHRFADEGAKVVIANRTRVNGEKVAGEILEKGGAACYIPCDVALPESIDGLLRQAVEKYGPVHVAVSNAGISEMQPSALDLTVEEWDRIMNVNARGSFLFCRACANNMIENNLPGSIVTVASVMARGVKTGVGAYAASKAAVVMFTKNLAKCLAPMNIRVNCVSPGVVATEIWHTVEDAMMMEKDSFADWLIEQSVASGQVLIPRCGTADEIAAAIAFLASDEASYITAQNLSVDGGTDWCW